MFKLLKSVLRSMGRAAAQDPEVRALQIRHPRGFLWLSRRMDPRNRYGLSLTFGIALSGVGLYLFLTLFIKITAGVDSFRADPILLHLVQYFRAPGLTGAMHLITTLGKLPVLVAGVFFLGLGLWLCGRRLDSAWVVFSAILGGFLVNGLKLLAARPRPPLEDSLSLEPSFSFPSGHAFFAFAFYGLLAALAMGAFRNLWSRTFIVLAALILALALGLSRLYLGVHWPTDVLAGYALGFAWLAAFLAARRALRPDTRPAPVKAARFNCFALTAGLVLLWSLVLSVYVLTHPMALNLPSEAEVLTPLASNAIPELFQHVPRTSETLFGQPMEPINIILVGSRRDVEAAFQTAGWYRADPPALRSALHLIGSSLNGRPYLHEPGAPAFWNTFPNDFAYEKPEHGPGERYHIHFWAAPFQVDGAGRIWLATAHYDRESKAAARFGVAIHSIDPWVDRVRSYIASDLQRVGRVRQARVFSLVQPRLGRNMSGDVFYTDGLTIILFIHA